MDRWMNGWVDSEMMHGCMDGRMNELMDWWKVNGKWMDDGWIDG